MTDLTYEQLPEVVREVCRLLNDMAEDKPPHFNPENAYWRRARDLVARLPKPVDEVTKRLREIVASELESSFVGAHGAARLTRRGEADNEFNMGLARAVWSAAVAHCGEGR